LDKVNYFFSRDFLRRRLFTANEVFQRVILHVRMMCERASSCKDGSGSEEHGIIMIAYDSSQTYTLEQFEAIQDQQIELALSKLKALKEETMELTYASCIVILKLDMNTS
jgi:hypothetical protein